MSPLIIETLQEQQCLNNLTKKDWKGNYNYWTGGSQQGCKGVWGWCDPEGIKPLDSLGTLQWETGQPDDKGGNQDCVHLKYMVTAGKVPVKGFFLTDRNCSDRYIFACEVKIHNLESGERGGIIF